MDNKYLHLFDKLGIHANEIPHLGFYFIYAQQTYFVMEIKEMEDTLVVYTPDLYYLSRNNRLPVFEAINTVNDAFRRVKLVAKDNCVWAYYLLPISAISKTHFSEENIVHELQIACKSFQQEISKNTKTTHSF